jgi:hypothetical protein
VVSDAGVVPALRLGESAGLYDLLEEALTVDPPNATAKSTCVVGGMLADADSIDDLETRVEVNRGGPGNPLSDEELARKFHDQAVRSLPEERAAEIAARGETPPPGPGDTPAPNPGPRTGVRSAHRH